MRPDPPAKSPTPETSAPPSPRPGVGPGGRPRLNLQKRTVSEADPAASPSAGTDSKASPFGAARPVDTATKERAIEEKRQAAIRERKEAEDKVKAEKAEEKRLAKEKTDAEKPESPKLTKTASRGELEEEEKQEKPAAPKFDILRRESTNDMIAEDEQEEAVGPEVDREVKPKEIVVPSSQANGGSWRKAGPKSPAPETPTTAENLEEDGWSTVSKPNKQRNNRRGAPRAIAS
jgi:translation initiation factor 4B